MNATAGPIADLFTRAEIAAVRSTSNWKGLVSVATCWAWIFGAIALFALWPNPISFVLGLMIVGGRQLGLAVLMHDAAHGILTRHKGLNEWVGHWLCGAPIASDMKAYRTYHLKHHRHVQQPEDPDLILSAPFPVTRASLRRKIVRDLTGQTFLKQRSAQLRAALGKPGEPFTKRLATFRAKLGPFVLTNAILLGLLALFGQAHLYLLLWLLPAATWFAFVTRIRNIGEHAVVPDNDDPLRNARTTYADPIVRLLLAPYRVSYHLEHHLFMWVPHYNLPKLHDMLLAKGLGPQMEIQPDYWAVLARAASKPDKAAA